MYESDQNTHDSFQKNKNVPYITLSSNNESSEMKRPQSDLAPSQILDSQMFDSSYLTSEQRRRNEEYLKMIMDWKIKNAKKQIQTQKLLKDLLNNGPEAKEMAKEGMNLRGSITVPKK